MSIIKYNENKYKKAAYNSGKALGLGAIMIASQAFSGQSADSAQSAGFDIKDFGVKKKYEKLKSFLGTQAESQSKDTSKAFSKGSDGTNEFLGRGKNNYEYDKMSYNEADGSVKLWDKSHPKYSVTISIKTTDGVEAGTTFETILRKTVKNNEDKLNGYDGKGYIASTSTKKVAPVNDQDLLARATSLYNSIKANKTKLKSGFSMGKTGTEYSVADQKTAEELLQLANVKGISVDGNYSNDIKAVEAFNGDGFFGPKTFDKVRAASGVVAKLGTPNTGKAQSYATKKAVSKPKAQETVAVGNQDLLTRATNLYKSIKANKLNLKRGFSMGKSGAEYSVADQKTAEELLQLAGVKGITADGNYSNDKSSVKAHFGDEFFGPKMFDAVRKNQNVIAAIGTPNTGKANKYVAKTQPKAEKEVVNTVSTQTTYDSSAVAFKGRMSALDKEIVSKKKQLKKNYSIGLAKYDKQHIATLEDALGIIGKNVTKDGKYNEQSAVKEIQKANGKKQDGYVGTGTLKLIRDNAEMVKYIGPRNGSVPVQKLDVLAKGPEVKSKEDVFSTKKELDSKVKYTNETETLKQILAGINAKDLQFTSQEAKDMQAEVLRAKDTKYSAMKDNLEVISNLNMLYSTLDSKVKGGDAAQDDLKQAQWLKTIVDQGFVSEAKKVKSGKNFFGKRKYDLKKLSQDINPMAMNIKVPETPKEAITGETKAYVAKDAETKTVDAKKVGADVDVKTQSTGLDSLIGMSVSGMGSRKKPIKLQDNGTSNGVFKAKFDRTKNDITLEVRAKDGMFVGELREGDKEVCAFDAHTAQGVKKQVESFVQGRDKGGSSLKTGYMIGAGLLAGFAIYKLATNNSGSNATPAPIAPTPVAPVTPQVVVNTNPTGNQNQFAGLNESNDTIDKFDSGDNGKGGIWNQI